MYETSKLIQDLAKNILSHKRFEEATKLCEKINDKNNWPSKKILMELLEKTPDSEINAKQLEYAKHDIQDIEKRTRDIVERSAASIETICKWILRYKINEYPEMPLGPVLEKLGQESTIKPELIKILKDFNRIIWNPAKHDYQSYRDIRDHLFSVNDTVFVLYIVNALTWELYHHIPDHYWRILIPKPD